MIEEILDFSKIEAGRLDIESRPFALTSMIEESVELMAPRAQTKGIEIVSYVDERVPANVIGDVARLRQVLLNLIGNAVKFTEHGGIGVVVEPGDYENEIHIQVRDTGIGISQDDLLRIFHDFEQADGSPTRKYGGTGLGLQFPSVSSSAWMGASMLRANSVSARSSVSACSYCRRTRRNHPSSSPNSIARRS